MKICKVRPNHNQCCACIEKVALSRIYDVKETKGESYHEK